MQRLVQGEPGSEELRRHRLEGATRSGVFDALSAMSETFINKRSYRKSTESSVDVTLAAIRLAQPLSSHLAKRLTDIRMTLSSHVKFSNS